MWSTPLRCTSRRARCSCSQAAKRPRSRSRGSACEASSSRSVPLTSRSPTRRPGRCSPTRAWTSRRTRCDALNERAEGWAAGLYLAALSLQASEGPPGSRAVRRRRSLRRRLPALGAPRAPEAGRDRVPDAHVRPRSDDGVVLRCSAGPDGLGKDARGARARELVRRRARPPQRAGIATTTSFATCCGPSSSAGSRSWSPSCIVGLLLGVSRITSRTGRSTTARRRGTSTRWPSWWRRTRSRSTATGASRPSSGGWRRSTSRSCSRATPRLRVFGAWVTRLARTAGRGGALGAGRRELGLRRTDARRKSFAAPVGRAASRAPVPRTGSTRMRADAEIAIEELSPQSPWMPIALLMRGVAALLAGEIEEADADAGAGGRGGGRRRARRTPAWSRTPSSRCSRSIAATSTRPRRSSRSRAASSATRNPANTSSRRSCMQPRRGSRSPADRARVRGRLSSSHSGSGR